MLHAKNKGEVIRIVEGEKDADNLVKLGLCATTPPNGAGKWLDIHTRALEGAQVWIIADNDSVGRDHAKMVSNTLQQNGCTVINWVPPNNY